MDDSISRQAAIKAIKLLFPDIPQIDFMRNRRILRERNKQYLDALEAIRSLPAVDAQPERKKGMWINDRGLYKCSCCNRLWTEWWAISKPIERMRKECPYCPMCGSYNGEEING